MTCFQYIITNFINIVTSLLNTALCGYSIDILSKNKHILSNFDVTTNCKKIYSFNVTYTVLSGLFVLATLPRNICNLLKTRPTLVWNISDWLILSLIFGVSWWGYELHLKLTDQTYCNGAFHNEYKELGTLVDFQLLNTLISIGLYILGVLLIFIMKRCNTTSVKDKNSSRFVM